MNKNKPDPNYFFVNRTLLYSDRWLSEPFTRGQAWIDLFGLAQHGNGFFRVRGIRVNVQRGQLAYSQVTLAKRWKWSRNKVRRYLKELEKEGDVKQQNNEVTTIITILNYDKWQGNKPTNDTTNDTAEGQQKDSRRTANGTHTKNDKNDKKEILKKDIFSPEEFPHFVSDTFKDIWEAWLEVREKKKVPNTQRALKIALNKLHKCSMKTAVEILEKAVERGWRGIFPSTEDKPEEKYENA